MIQNLLTVGGLMTLFVLSLAVPGAIVLTAVQLALLVATSVVVYQKFGDHILAFINALKGDSDVAGEAAVPAGTGVQERQPQEPTVGAASGPTEGERDPS